ncbi:hypothetical protein [Halobacterium noricense]|uniref:hypothetical protein n=1 Tax=Halobacterium noricense TaxID=223182 RepID=UPI001E4F16DD|nr:hypothetical protein [Halobacterium noricense]UHH24349.1 hypothetical protein LT974_10150 [Halobacterium noricense]
MTITSGDITTAEAQMGPFGAQDDLTADLPNVLQNMLAEFSGRNGIPDELTISERTARDICDHKDIGSFSLDIASRLTAELSDYPFRGVYQDGLGIDTLEQIVEDSNRSLPIVQLSPSYFEHCEGYSIQSDSRNSAKDPYILAMNINHSEVLLYDPYRFGNDGDGDLVPTRIGKSDFESSWLGKYENTSTLWVEGTDQKRIAQFQ